MFSCEFCGKRCATDQQLRRHMAKARACRDAYNAQGPQRRQNALDVFAGDLRNAIDPPALRRHPSVEVEEVPDEEFVGGQAGVEEGPPEAAPHEVPRFDNEDLANGLFYRRKCKDPNAGKPISMVPGVTTFEYIRAEQEAHGFNRYYPFPDLAEWNLAAYAVRNLNAKQIDGLLAMPCVSKGILFGATLVLRVIILRLRTGRTSRLRMLETCTRWSTVSARIPPNGLVMRRL
jgi:hypothetical protein